MLLILIVSAILQMSENFSYSDAQNFSKISSLLIQFTVWFWILAAWLSQIFKALNILLDLKKNFLLVVDCFESYWGCGIFFSVQFWLLFTSFENSFSQLANSFGAVHVRTLTYLFITRATLHDA